MKPPISLSVNPSYYCNFRCDFCYLTPTQLGDKTRLPLERLDAMLLEVSESYSIVGVDLYGGETLLLPKWYLTEIKALFHKHGITSINLITNLSIDSPFLDDPDFYIAVSYDFDVREKSDEVLARMMSLNRKFSVLMLASPELVRKDPELIVETFNLFTNLENIEVKPYSSNQANQLDVTYREYEEFVKSIILAKTPKKFTFTNELQLEDALAKQRNAYSDDHLYVTPKGRYGLLDFDLEQNEYFLEFDDLAYYAQWELEEKQMMLANPICSQCEYQGNCLSEHLKWVDSLEDGCNGFKGLLDWGMVNGYGSIEEPPWRVWQRIYASLVETHEDAIENFNIVTDDEIVSNALEYFEHQRDVAVYPAKSYAVAIVYATFLSEWYSVDFYEVLNDTDLFLGADPNFLPYRRAVATYDAILEGLSARPDWRTGGWSPKSFGYCYLECTGDGVQETSNKLFS